MFAAEGGPEIAVFSRENASVAILAADRKRSLWWFQKSSGFYSCRPPHCPVDASSLVFCSTELRRKHTSADVYPTDTTTQLSCTRHLLIAADTTDNSVFLSTCLNPSRISNGHTYVCHTRSGVARGGQAPPPNFW